MQEDGWPSIAEWAESFAEPLVPFGAPTAGQTGDLADALRRHSERLDPQDFSAISEYIEAFPESPWCPSLLFALGLEYYGGGHSRVIPTWRAAWTLSKDATDVNLARIADRCVGELAGMLARLGRMAELEELLASIEDCVLSGPAPERIAGARDGLDNMRERPEIAFRCRALAVRSVQLVVAPDSSELDWIHDAASTSNGFSLSQVALQANDLGLDYRVAFRDRGSDVVSWCEGPGRGLAMSSQNDLLLVEHRDVEERTTEDRKPDPIIGSGPVIQADDEDPVIRTGPVTNAEPPWNGRRQLAEV